jgi:hypothetical protein
MVEGKVVEEKLEEVRWEMVLEVKGEKVEVKEKAEKEEVKKVAEEKEEQQYLINKTPCNSQLSYKLNTNNH